MKLPRSEAGRSGANGGGSGGVSTPPSLPPSSPHHPPPPPNMAGGAAARGEKRELDGDIGDRRRGEETTGDIAVASVCIESVRGSC